MQFLQNMPHSLHDVHNYNLMQFLQNMPHSLHDVHNYNLMQFLQNMPHSLHDVHNYNRMQFLQNNQRHRAKEIVYMEIHVFSTLACENKNGNPPNHYLDKQTYIARDTWIKLSAHVLYACCIHNMQHTHFVLHMIWTTRGFTTPTLHHNNNNNNNNRHLENTQ